jgi:transcriptional regulator of acetoin/glycerol metabolism
MIDDQDLPVDLGPLKAEMDHRALQVTSRVLERITDLRARDRVRSDVFLDVQRRLARFAWPGAIAAAISVLAILTTRSDERTHQPELFAVMVMGQSPAAKWIALGELPEIPELLQAMEPR